MDKKLNSPRQHVLLFGQQNLQNSILIGYIHQRAQVDCQLITQAFWQPEWTQQNAKILVLVDAEMARPERLQDLLEQIYEQPLDLRVAFFNVPESHPVERMLVWPMVTGLFYRDSTQQQLCKGILALFDGEYWLPRQLVADYLQRTRQKPRRMGISDTVLTRREKQILRLTATGATNIEIADQLNVSMHTVKTHIYNLFKKIGVANRIQAVNWAKEYMEELLHEAVE